MGKLIPDSTGVKSEELTNKDPKAKPASPKDEVVEVNFENKSIPGIKTNAKLYMRKMKRHIAKMDMIVKADVDKMESLLNDLSDDQLSYVMNYDLLRHQVESDEGKYFVTYKVKYVPV